MSALNLGEHIGSPLQANCGHMIAIIDYDMGNLRSVSKALERVGAKVCVARDRKKIQNSSKIVLPGVGAFPKCVENLKKYDLFDLIPEEIKKGKPFLGICLGLQLLFEESEEFGGAKGLGILKGKVVRFPSPVVRLPADDLVEGRLSPGKNNTVERRATSNERLKIPHMGWNSIQKKGDPVLLKGIPDQSLFYFVHSYYVDSSDKSYIGTETEYEIRFCSSVQKDNIFAFQFHPEKSQKLGLKILENFTKLK